MELSISDLPEGTVSIQLPDGKILNIGESSTMQFDISRDDIDENSMVEIVALNQEGVPLATIGMKIASDIIELPNSATAWDNIWPILMWVLIGIGAIVIIGGVLYAIAKKRNV